jgi:hypothetical protein
MEDVCNKRCEESGCKTQPSFGEAGQDARFCFEHKKEGMENVVAKRCLVPLCTTTATIEKYRGYCMRCFVYLFPDESMTRNYKTKERSVADFIREQFPDITWTFDKRITNGESRRRPDAVADPGDQVIVVEVDENQHVSYDCTCENKRIMEISRDFAHRPIVFIRFNPDGYTCRMHGVPRQVGSCWTTDARGMCVVAYKQQDEWTRRLGALQAQITYWLQHTTDKIVEVIQLFFDE